MFGFSRLGSPVIGLGLLLCSRVVMAQELGDAQLDARNIGRAGASTVSGDSGVALVLNPAGMVRRAQPRVILGLGITESDTAYTSLDATAPVILNRAPPTTLPSLAYHHGSANGRWVLGVLLRSGSASTSLATPAFGQPAQDVEQLFPHRYGGTRAESTWRQLAVGAATRIGDSWGLGLSAGLRDVEVVEERRMWAGFAGRDRLLGAERDLELSIRARDRVNPSASAGLFFAPLSLPLEFAVSLEAQAGPRYTSSQALASTTTSSEFPRIETTDSAAEMNAPHRATARGGVRYLGERVLLEASVEATTIWGGESDWRVEGLTIIDESTATTDLEGVAALHSERSHAALRGAIDVEVLSGFLWLTSGYAFHTPRTGQNARMPAYAKLGGHRLAVGLLAAHEGYSLSVGYARALRRTRSIDIDSATDAIAPFDGGSGPSNAGRYESVQDQLGFSLELTF